MHTVHTASQCALNNLITHAYLSDSIPLNIEPGGLSCTDGRRPWASRKCLTLDVTIVCPLAGHILTQNVQKLACSVCCGSLAAK